MNKIIINVGRQIGSGGHIIAEKLAEDFGCKCYDRELLNLAAKERKILIFTFPMHWKKLVMTIWNPMTGKQNITTLQQQE
jgi:hypothetical protein